MARGVVLACAEDGWGERCAWARLVRVGESWDAVGRAIDPRRFPKGGRKDSPAPSSMFIPNPWITP